MADSQIHLFFTEKDLGPLKSPSETYLSLSSMGANAILMTQGCRQNCQIEKLVLSYPVRLKKNRFATDCRLATPWTKARAPVLLC